MTRLHRIITLRHGQRGSAAILFVLCLPVLLGFAALAMDVGMLHLTKVEMQNAADAAALAGAQDLPNASNAISSSKDFAELNGAEKSNTTATTPYDGDSTKVEVVCTKNVEYSFARVLGFTDADVSARAVAQKISLFGGYAIFSGDPGEKLTLNGEGIDVIGAVHTNNIFEANGERITVSDVVEAPDGYILNGADQDIPNLADDPDNIPLASYAESIGLDDGDPDEDNPGYLVDSELESATTYSGDKEIDSNPSNNVYAKGKVEIKTDGLTITHSIIAEKEIIINANDLVFDCPLIYSKKEKIVVNGDNIAINGILYSPKDWVEINNSNDPATINGRIVADKVKLNGPDITVDASSLSGPGGSGVRLIE